ncbi:MAG: cobalamin biosynthesis protein [Candidatus Geothermarchaeales archaeon]
MAPTLVLVLALLMDITLGEPPEKFHPTVWMGKVIAFLEPRMKNRDPRIERLNGVLLGLFVTTLFVVLVYLILSLVDQLFGLVAFIVLAAILLKTTFAVKCMGRFTLPIAMAVEQGNIDEARRLLHHVVGREVAKLNEQQILSATVETISEGTVDGITSSLFYYVLFGVPGAIAFRVINTLDSMVGYRDREHVNIGWFSAKLDTLANYVPARITAFLMIVATWFLREKYRDAWRILIRDRGKTGSLNAGWPMSTVAGALGVRLEKPGFYALGEDTVTLSPKHIPRALRIMELTTYLFVALVTIPLSILNVMIIG